jgi:hypothetical protein
VADDHDGADGERAGNAKAAADMSDEREEDKDMPLWQVWLHIAVMVGSTVAAIWFFYWVTYQEVLP